jgi:hypothetical protein
MSGRSLLLLLLVSMAMGWLLAAGDPIRIGWVIHGAHSFSVRLVCETNSNRTRPFGVVEAVSAKQAETF